jgi:hypothetical protein
MMRNLLNLLKLLELPLLKEMGTKRMVKRSEEKRRRPWPEGWSTAEGGVGVGGNLNARG